MRGAPYADKQKAWGDGKLWWFVVVTRGVVKFEVMGADWGQTGDGMAEFVQKLPGALTEMLGHGTVKPKVIMSDRGPGFYQALSCGQCGV